MTTLEREALILSLYVSGWAILVSFPFGVIIAWILARKSFPGKFILDGFVHLPLVLPPVVMGYILLVSLGRKGLVGAWLYEYFGITFSFSWKGAAIASAVMGFPLLVRAVRLSIESVDQGLESAAATLGAAPLRIFLTVTMPLALPGIITGIVLAFARSLSEFGATITFVSNIPGQTQTLPLALYAVSQVPGGDAQAMRLCIISVILAVTALAVSEWMSRYSYKRIHG
jgi:molybdate transport system permease protein